MIISTSYSTADTTLDMGDFVINFDVLMEDMNYEVYFKSTETADIELLLSTSLGN